MSDSVKNNTMNVENKNFADSAKDFTKSPLGIIALFIVLVYGFATIATTFGRNIENHIDPLIYFLVLFPVVVFIGFLWLVSKHSDKIYGPSDFRNEDNFFRMKMNTVAALAAAAAKSNFRNTENLQLESDMTANTDQLQLESIVDLVSQTPIVQRNNLENWKNKILWVDDNPSNNINEQKAFESQGFSIRSALSTSEALQLLQDQKFGAIISDMGRKEGSGEGYVLLEALRKNGNGTPLFIYAGSNDAKHKVEALEKGAQGSTNRPNDLFKMVTEALR